jgi:hypothetical protein
VVARTLLLAGEYSRIDPPSTTDAATTSGFSPIVFAGGAMGADFGYSGPDDPLVAGSSSRRWSSTLPRLRSGV